MKFKQFSLEQIVEEFPTSSMYLLDEEEYAFNNLFGYFMYYYFGIELIDLLPTIQYASTYFYFSIELRLPSIIDYKRDEISDVRTGFWGIYLLVFLGGVCYVFCVNGLVALRGENYFYVVYFDYSWIICFIYFSFFLFILHSSYKQT